MAKKAIRILITLKMPSLKYLTYVLVIFTLTSFTEESIPIHRSHFCSNTTFSPNTAYQSHLNKLLSSLSSAAALGDFFVQKTVAGPAATIYGSHLCRGDLDAATCMACVATATDEASERCPFKKEAVLWYDQCMLRYSNRSFFGIMEEKPSCTLVDSWNGTRQEAFRKALEEAVMSESTLAEASDQNGTTYDRKYFRTKEVKVASFQTIYSLVQCTPDLASEECRKCLRDAMGMIGSCCKGKEGATILFPSCHFRYELFRFYDQNSSTDSVERKPKETERVSTVVVIGIVTFLLLSCLPLGYYLSRLRRRSDAIPQQTGNEITSTDSFQFNLDAIETATNKFSDDYRLGRGGFGDVYKGILPDGQQIAVKRPLKSSGRESQQFKNEVALIAKLQHRNLVRLLGFCLEGGDTMLVYEFVPNKSLDYFLFDHEKRILLDWPTRCKIIDGIARGILYLHEDSRLRIIHRDLKASNILLDGDMNPKIADFGIAKMFGIDDQTEGITKTIVGTYGYMAPEYAMRGLYSTKSDVFSYGVLLLEILSGTKNSAFHTTKLASCLLSYAWQLWNEGRGLEFMDQALNNSCPATEFLRYMHIGLLCVQEVAHLRPTMSFVALLLKSESANINLPEPGRPPLSDNEHVEECSTSGLTVSVLEPR